MPIWFGDVVYPSHPWWHGATDEQRSTDAEFNAASEVVLAAQTYILDNALDKMADERAGETDVYFVAFAPHGRSDAYRVDAEAAQHVMDSRWGTDGRSIVLVNNPKTLVTAPFATVTNLRETLNEIGGAIDQEDDVVMIYIASPIARNNQIAAEQPPLGARRAGTFRPEAAPRRCGHQVAHHRRRRVLRRRIRRDARGRIHAGHHVVQSGCTGLRMRRPHAADAVRRCVLRAGTRQGKHLRVRIRGGESSRRRA